MTAQPASASPVSEPESASVAQKRKLSDIQGDTKMNGATPDKEESISPEPTTPDPRVQRLISDVFVVLQRCDLTPSQALNSEIAMELMLT
jgi:hypothetical protein